MDHIRFGQAFRTTFRSVSVRNFRLFFFGQLISQIGTWLTTVALTLLILHLAKSGVAIGVLAACQFGPVLALGAYGGIVVDRCDKRRLLLVTQILQLVQSLALGALAFSHHPPVIAYYLTALAGGVILAFDLPARRSFVPEMVPPANVHNAVSLNTALMMSSRVVGPALAGVLVVTLGYGWAFTADAISYLTVIAALWMMRTEELHRPAQAPRSPKQIREGLRYARSVGDLWIPLIMVSIVGTVAFNFAVVLPLFVERSLGGGDTAYTVLYSVLSVGSFAGALLMAHRSVVEVRHLVFASSGLALAMLALAAVPTIVAAFPVALMVGLTSVAFMTAATAIVQVRADPAMRGRVLALQGMVLIGSTPIGGPVLGAVSDALGPRSALIIGGLGAFAAAAYGRSADRRRHPVESGTRPEGLAVTSEARPL